MQFISDLDEIALFKARDRAKDRFSAFSSIQNNIGDRLIARLDAIKISPKRILDFGWQTAHTTKALQKRYDSAEICAIDNQCALLALPDHSINLIISNLALLWEKNPITILQAFFRILCNDGLLLLTTLGPDTLTELKQSFQSIDDFPQGHALIDMHHIGDWLKQLRFDDPVVDCELLTITYDRLSELFDDLKNTASVNCHMARRKSLMPKSKWQSMLARYEDFKTDHYYPATLEVIYGHAWKLEKKYDAEEEWQQEIAIPVGNIKKR